MTTKLMLAVTGLAVICGLLVVTTGGCGATQGEPTPGGSDSFDTPPDATQTTDDTSGDTSDGASRQSVTLTLNLANDAEDAGASARGLVARAGVEYPYDATELASISVASGGVRLGNDCIGDDGAHRTFNVFIMNETGEAMLDTQVEGISFTGATPDNAPWIYGDIPVGQGGSGPRWNAVDGNEQVWSFAYTGTLALTARVKASWVPAIANTKDASMRLLRIPAGLAIFGANDSLLTNEQPQFTASLPAYYLGETEVTNAQYALFLTDQQPTGAELSSWIDLAGNAGNYWKCRVVASGVSSAPVSYAAEADWEDNPVTHVSWNGAKAYCDWAGLRLPSELEWEKGARGTAGREYPWGGSGYLNGWDQAKCRNRYNGLNLDRSTAAVGSYPSGDSPYGLKDMAGNVFEWCADRYESSVYTLYSSGNLIPPASGEFRVLRGGAWHYAEQWYFRGAFRYYGNPVTGSYDYGFRCARTP